MPSFDGPQRSEQRHSPLTIKNTMLPLPTGRYLVTERVRAVAEGLCAAAGSARMKARTVELAGDLSGCDDQTGEAFMLFAAELEIVADQMLGRAPQGDG